MHLARIWRGVSQDSLLKVLSIQNISTFGKSIPRITIPQKMVLNINKVTAKNEGRKRPKKPLRFKSPLVISCHREQFNHHKGQTYSDFDAKILASYGWKHRKSSGDHFTLMDWNSNPSIVKEPKSFEDLNIIDSLIGYLRNEGIKTPTDIQIRAIPEILRGNNIICAAETGSGKTLSYLLPIFQLIKQHKELIQESKHKNSPKSIILVPSRELAVQIMSVVEGLTKFVPLQPQLILGKVGTEEKLKLKGNMDILVTTSGALKAMIKLNRIKFSKLVQLVLDEADTLMDDSFSSDVASIFNHMKSHIQSISAGDLEAANPSSEALTVPMSGTQIVLTSATMPTSLDEKIGTFVPMETFTKVTTSHLHHIPRHIKQKFVRLLPSEKPGYVLKFVKQMRNKTSSVMLFCKDNASSFWLYKFLQENGVEDTYLFNGMISAEDRKLTYQKFLNRECKILVATDVASRGLDTTHVQTVFNYDFPSFVSDYIHRVGRVGRLGSNNGSGVISLVAHNHEVDRVWILETAARKMKEIHNVNANIKRKHVGRHEGKLGSY
ncbi:probable ATP-dependent RNA helicase DDX28 [Argonauta hians]